MFNFLNDIDKIYHTNCFPFKIISKSQNQRGLFKTYHCMKSNTGIWKDRTIWPKLCKDTCN